MRIIIGMTWKELLRKRVMVLTLLMTIVFLIGFWFVANTIGQSGIPNRTDISSGEHLLANFTNGAFILSLGFFFGAFVLAFWRSSVPSQLLQVKRNKGLCRLYCQDRCRGGNGTQVAGLDM